MFMDKPLEQDTISPMDIIAWKYNILYIGYIHTISPMDIIAWKYSITIYIGYIHMISPKDIIAWKSHEGKRSKGRPEIMDR